MDGMGTGLLLYLKICYNQGSLYLMEIPAIIDEDP